MKEILIAAATLSLAACAVPQTNWSKPGASAADFEQDKLQCDYEATSATQRTDYSYGTLVGQELDRANRKLTLMQKCLAARGWTQAGPGPSERQRLSWVRTIASRNGCPDAAVELKSSDGVREIYAARCVESSSTAILEVTCEFSGSVDVRSGLPFNRVAGKSYTHSPACWL